MTTVYYIPTGLEAGDQLAFHTKGFIPWVIRLASPGVNHIETIARNPKSGMLEAFSARKDGLSFKPILEVVRDAKGKVRLHRLKTSVRKKLDFERMEAAVNELDGKTYDFLHVIGVGIDDWHINLLKHIPKVPNWLINTLKVTFRNAPSMEQAVCSSVWEWMVIYHGLSKTDTNPSEQTPNDSCAKAVFRPYQVLKDEDWEIRDYNTKEI